MSISIEQAKQIREDIGASHLILLAMWPDGSEHVTTHGKNEQQAHEAADFGNRQKKHMGWPEDLCQSQPAQRENWARKTADQIKQQIEALRREGQEYADEFESLDSEGAESEKAGVLFVSMRQVSYAIQQLEWVLKPDTDE
ncbi:hypothetical protein [Hymenobacter sp. YC55]|uniref:hypothetical protein n=1 Tax=Hymenobacter sp. YC55 TaxID=3034019 RepID=UPI0023F99E10|nr:hypothetical protein [Hymenobacter sp. YC55]MDF7810486.1 hypothetical protein [Hymenobacter sp. YC55]